MARPLNHSNPYMQQDSWKGLLTPRGLLREAVRLAEHGVTHIELYTAQHVLSVTVLDAVVGRQVERRWQAVLSWRDSSGEELRGPVTEKALGAVKGLYEEVCQQWGPVKEDK